MNSQELTPQYISAYCDSQMRVGFKGLQDSEVTSQLDAIVRLFCCLHGRDIFIKSYTRYFGYRLLNKSYLSKDFEELMLQRLRVECGHNTVNKLA
jgi:cullin 3